LLKAIRKRAVETGGRKLAAFVFIGEFFGQQVPEKLSFHDGR
jgi:hypothetical protein